MPFCAQKPTEIARIVRKIRNTVQVSNPLCDGGLDVGFPGFRRWRRDFAEFHREAGEGDAMADGGFLVENGPAAAFEKASGEMAGMGGETRESAVPDVVQHVVVEIGGYAEGARGWSDKEQVEMAGLCEGYEAEKTGIALTDPSQAGCKTMAPLPIIRFGGCPGAGLGGGVCGSRAVPYGIEINGIAGGAVAVALGAHAGGHVTRARVLYSGRSQSRASSTSARISTALSISASER